MSLALDNSTISLPANARTVTTLTDYLANNAVFNVKDYGAAVDGSTDDTMAFADAISAAGTAGGGLVVIPAGTMLADPPSLLPANVTIRGEGRDVSIVQAVSATGCFAGQDVSNITLQDFTFVGLANNGANVTSPGVNIQAVTGDVSGILIERVAVRQTKSQQGAINVIGDGDDVTAATYWVRAPRVSDCVVDTYYDQDPTNLGVGSYGIFVGYGCSDAVITCNTVDGSKGKHGIGSIGDIIRQSVTENSVVNSGLDAPNTYYGYGIFAYANTVHESPSVVVSGNHIRQTNRAGIYIQGIRGGVVSANALVKCDTHSAGLGGTGVGAISVNENSNDAREGPVSVTGNTIQDPGSIGINIGLLASLTTLSPVTVCGNALINTAPTTALFGIVIAGSGWAVSDNAMVGFTDSLFLNNSLDNVVGNGTIVGNVCDMTGTTGGRGISCNNATKTIGALNLSGNHFLAGATGIDVRLTSVLTCANNTFTAMTGANLTIIAHQGAVTGNVTDAGTVGANIQCVSGDSNARITVSGNIMILATTPYTFTPNTGQILCTGNDFGVLPGLSANHGDASATTTLTAFDVQQWSTTLTANRTHTLSGTSAYKGARIRTVRNAATPGAFTLAIVDGVSSTTLFTIPASQQGWVDAEFDGTNWKYVGS